MSFLEQYYNNYDEEGRLLSNHGQVEYRTTVKYIEESLEGISNPEILEVGAGTGRYSVTLAKKGLHVTAVELIPHNLEILRSKVDRNDPITVIEGNALDLSALCDNTFDLTMVLGPMYHLFTKEDKVKALSEAVRVTKPGGRILVSYCMNEPTIVHHFFAGGNLQSGLSENMIDEDWHCVSDPKYIFEVMRTEEIEELDKALSVTRIKIVATDGATNYMRPLIDSIDDDTFEKWVEYHFSICERQDLIGASHHTLDILQKEG